MPVINFIPFPVLTTEHFVLRQLSESDAEPIYILRTDNEVNRYIARKRAASLDDVLVFINNINANISKNEAILWAICTKNDRGLIGTICLWNINASLAVAEIGYELLPQHHGKKIMQEVIPVVVRYAFEAMQLNAVTAELSMQNLRSVRLLEKQGFIVEKAGMQLEQDEKEADWVSYRLDNAMNVDS